MRPDLDDRSVVADFFIRRGHVGPSKRRYQGGRKRRRHRRLHQFQRAPVDDRYPPFGVHHDDTLADGIHRIRQNLARHHQLSHMRQQDSANQQDQQRQAGAEYFVLQRIMPVRCEYVVGIEADGDNRRITRQSLERHGLPRSVDGAHPFHRTPFGRRSSGQQRRLGYILPHTLAGRRGRAEGKRPNKPVVSHQHHRPTPDVQLPVELGEPQWIDGRRHHAHEPAVHANNLAGKEH